MKTLFSHMERPMEANTIINKYNKTHSLRMANTYILSLNDFVLNSRVSFAHLSVFLRDNICKLGFKEIIVIKL